MLHDSFATNTVFLCDNKCQLWPTAECDYSTKSKS